MPSWVDHCLDLLAPDQCLLCGNSSAAGGICRGCEQELPWNDVACPACAQPTVIAALCPHCLKRLPAYDAAWTPFIHIDPIRRSVHRLKYRAQFSQARTMGRLMADRLRSSSRTMPDLLIPVPVAKPRLILRGYNQTVVLGHHLSRCLGIELDSDAAKMRRQPKEQIGQTAAQRKQNLRGAFVIERNLRDQRVALIDDVMTTGATLDALARAARKAGASYVDAWALARAP